MKKTKLKGRIKKWILFGRFNSIFRSIYNVIIALELTIQQILDNFFPPLCSEDAALLKNVTIIIKTFERPYVLDRLIKSIKKKYSAINIIVVDDSHNPIRRDDVQMIVMPYNSGISAGRNEALNNLTTKYFLLLDDDFIFNRHTNLQKPIEIMENFPKIDILGGQVVNLPFFRKSDPNAINTALFPTNARATMPPGSVIGGLPVYDKVPNFFIGRTDRVRLVGWDPDLKKIEHADFFTRAKGVLTTVYNPEFRCLHAQTPFDSAYMSIRNDFKQERIVLSVKYYNK